MRAVCIIAVLCCGLLGACVSANDPNAVAKATNTTFNPHTGLTTTSGAPSAINGNILEGMYNIRTMRAADGKTLHQLYLAVSAYEWLFLNSAYAYGQPLDFVGIDRSVGSCSKYGCNITETVGIGLTEDQLRQYALSGFTFQLTGQRGNRVITVPATYFQGYLQKMVA
jgi:hypothetical protein